MLRLLVIAYRFGPLDLGRVRFALSPLMELQTSFEALRDPERHVVHGPWARAARAALGGVDLGLLAALVPGRGYTPDFLAPPPAEPAPGVERELERVRATPAAQVHAELSYLLAGREPPPALRPLLDDPERGLAALCSLLRTYWRRALRPHWPRLRALCEADVARRARELAARGPLGVFGDLHPGLRWHDGALLADRPYDAQVELGGRGLLLVPVAFASGLGLIVDEPWQPAVLYPPPGVGGLWEPAAAGGGDALAPLVGERRAAILRALAVPASTTELAGRLGASPGGVSEHLGVLRRAGLVHGTRDGRVVRYVRTATAEALVAAAAAGQGMARQPVVSTARP